MPINPLQLVAFVVLLGLLLAFVQVGLLTVAFEKLGLSSHSAFLLLFVSLFGSALNLPTVKIAAERPPSDTMPEHLRQHHPIPLHDVGIAIAIVATIARVTSRPVPGLGIGMPIFVGPIAAALTALGLDPDNSAPLAYICGTLGVLIGADLLRLNDIRKMGVPVASIGGAGTFDGIFITGIVAVLLA